MSKWGVELWEPAEADLVFIARTMRESDVEEVRLSHGHTAEQAVRYSVQHSAWSLVAAVDGVPLGVFGVGQHSLMSTTGSPWGLASTLVRYHQRAFARVSRPIVQNMRKGYMLLENYVHAGNVVSIRWLRSCGFTLDPAAPFGPVGAPFHRFTMPGEP